MKSKASTSTKSAEEIDVLDDTNAQSTTKSVKFQEDQASPPPSSPILDVRKSAERIPESTFQSNSPFGSNKEKKKSKSLKSILKSATGVSGKSKSKKPNSTATNDFGENSMRPAKLEKQKSEQNTSSTSAKPIGSSGIAGAGFGGFRGMGMGIGPGVGMTRGISLNSIGIFSALNPGMALSDVIQQEKQAQDENISNPGSNNNAPQLLLFKNMSISQSGKFKYSPQPSPASVSLQLSRENSSQLANKAPLSSTSELPSIKEDPPQKLNESSKFTFSDRPMDHSPDSHSAGRKFITKSSPSTVSQVVLEKPDEFGDNGEIVLEPKFMSSARIDLSTLEEKKEISIQPLSLDEEKNLLLNLYPEEKIGSSKNNSSRNNSDRYNKVSAAVAAGLNHIKNDPATEISESEYFDKLQNAADDEEELDDEPYFEENEFIEGETGAESQSIHSDLLVDTGGDIGHECEVELDHWAIYHGEEAEEIEQEMFTGSNDHCGLDCLKSSSRSSLPSVTSSVENSSNTGSSSGHANGDDYWTLYDAGYSLSASPSFKNPLHVAKMSSPLNELHSIKRFNGKESRLSLKKLMPSHVHPNALALPRRSFDESSGKCTVQIELALTPEVNEHLNEDPCNEDEITDSSAVVMTLSHSIAESYESSLPQEIGLDRKSLDKHNEQFALLQTVKIESDDATSRDLPIIPSIRSQELQGIAINDSVDEEETVKVFGQESERNKDLPENLDVIEQALMYISLVEQDGANIDVVQCAIDIDKTTEDESSQDDRDNIVQAENNYSNGSSQSIVIATGSIENCTGLENANIVAETSSHRSITSGVSEPDSSIEDLLTYSHSLSALSISNQNSPCINISSEVVSPIVTSDRVITNILGDDMQELTDRLPVKFAESETDDLVLERPIMIDDQLCENINEDSMIVDDNAVAATSQCSLKEVEVSELPPSDSQFLKVGEEIEESNLDDVEIKDAEDDVIIERNNDENGAENTEMVNGVSIIEDYFSEEGTPSRSISHHSSTDDNEISTQDMVLNSSVVDPKPESESPVDPTPSVPEISVPSVRASGLASNVTHEEQAPAGMCCHCTIF